MKRRLPPLNALRAFEAAARLGRMTAAADELAVTPGAISRQVRTFEMPGTGILDYEAHAKAIARAGIYDFGIHHDQILVPVVLRHWGVESLEGLTPEAEVARAALVKRIERIGRAGRRLASRRPANEVELAPEPAYAAV